LTILRRPENRLILQLVKDSTRRNTLADRTRLETLKDLADLFICSGLPA
jgi:hypothetical protein